MKLDLADILDMVIVNLDEPVMKSWVMAFSLLYVKKRCLPNRYLFDTIAEYTKTEK